MNYALGYEKPEWHQSKEMVELLTMVSEHNNSGKSELAYMKMDTKGSNDFVDAKKAKNYLDDYSNLVEKKVVAKSFVSDVDIRNTYLVESNLSKSFKSIDFERAKEDKILSSKENVVKQVNKIKSELLINLDVASSNLDKFVVELNKKIKQAETGDKPDVEGIDAKNRRAFDLLKRTIERFSTAKHGTNNYRKLVRDYPNGILDTEHAELILNKVSEIVKSLRDRDQERQAKVYSRKITEWFGKETTQQWYDEIIKK
jgi:hypothetical protein